MNKENKKNEMDYVIIENHILKMNYDDKENYSFFNESH